MRQSEKLWKANHNKDIFGVNFHRFIELEENASHMEIAHELGISLGEVRMLKNQMNRT
ncbi:hypothetical protein ACFFIS_03270 [Virgibacillus soli]|uniref:hypothetical protein n=1 Tax=Paracerasibacillus soli TaxID=480284 RepID=UPI0035E67D49